jgi:2-isopropylmalate synthase
MNKSKVFSLVFYRYTDGKDGKFEPVTEIAMKAMVMGEEIITGEQGCGPVDAMYKVLIKILSEKFNFLQNVSLSKYNVYDIENGRKGSEKKVKVFIEFEDGNQKWSSTAVSKNIIEASYFALLENFYKKIKKEALPIAA